MKRLTLSAFTAVFMIALGSLTVLAQTRYTDAGSTSKFSIGIGAAGGFAVPLGDLDENDEAALGFAFRGGVNITYPFTTEMSAHLNAGLDIRNLGVKEDSSLDARFYNAQYFFVQPGISYSSIGLSLNIGVPVSASQPVPVFPGLPVTDPDATVEVPTETLELLLEPRLNGTLVLLNNEMLWLGVDISVGFPLNKLYKEEYQRDKDLDDGRTLVPNASPFAAHLGLTCQFGLFDAF